MKASLFLLTGLLLNLGILSSSQAATCQLGRSEELIMVGSYGDQLDRAANKMVNMADGCDDEIRQKIAKEIGINLMQRPTDFKYISAPLKRLCWGYPACTLEAITYITAAIVDTSDNLSEDILNHATSLYYSAPSQDSQLILKLALGSCNDRNSSPALCDIQAKYINTEKPKSLLEMRKLPAPPPETFTNN